MKFLTFTILTFIVLLGSNLQAQCINGSTSITSWSHQSITNPSQMIYNSTEMESGTYTATDSSGEKVTMTLEFQRDTNGNLSDGIGGFDYRIRQWDNASSNLKLTYDKPVAIQGLEIKDFDTQWDVDEVVVSAKNASGANIVVTINGDANVSVDQSTQTIRGKSDTKGNATLSTADEIIELNIQFNSGRVGQVQKGEQQILIGNLEFCYPSAQAASNPVSLIDFTAVRVQDYVELNWATATEADNEKFRVEYSFDGFNYMSAHEVKGAGTTSMRTDYSIIHAGILNQQTEKIYYRLAQIDFDGTLTYVGDVQTITQEVRNEIVVYPIPANVGQAVIVLGASQIGSYQVYNQAGQAIKRGFNTSSEMKLETFGLAQGAYYIHFATGEVKKIILN